ncbi:MAG: hypothetical protein QOK23_4503 [Gammaproteobacteria bacterium]|jgi:hypothetical protein|nr:hypothetical protein [Gammaproteobacteria bacterium]
MLRPMRTRILLSMMLAGCAAQGPPGAFISPSGAAAPTADIEAQRLAAAKNLNLKVMNKDGQELYCRANLVTGSHIQRDTRCYTGEQVDRMQYQAQRDFEQSSIRQGYQSPAKMP